jgi:hypothetical protein
VAVPGANGVAAFVVARALVGEARADALVEPVDGTLDEAAPLRAPRRARWGALALRMRARRAARQPVKI